MICRLSRCAFHEAKGENCFLSYLCDVPAEESFRNPSLVTASLDVGRALAHRQRMLFVAKGTCMYPCLKQGDILHVNPCSVEDAKEGDIAVIRRNTNLLGHRIIGKGVDDSLGSYIVTRSDRSSLGDDGPTWQDSLLGVVCEAERQGKALKLVPMKLHGLELIKVSIQEWWNAQAKSALVGYLSNIQQLAIYRPLVGGWLRMRYPDPYFLVRVPLSPRQKTDFHQQFPATGFDLRTVRQQDGEVVSWSIQIEIPKQVPAAQLSLVFRPDDCPDGGGWQIWRSWCRIRYRGAGLETRLVEEAQRIIARSGGSFCRNGCLSMR